MTPAQIDFRTKCIGIIGRKGRGTNRWHADAVDGLAHAMSNFILQTKVHTGNQSILQTLLATKRENLRECACVLSAVSHLAHEHALEFLGGVPEEGRSEWPKLLCFATLQRRDFPLLVPYFGQFANKGADQLRSHTKITSSNREQ